MDWMNTIKAIAPTIASALGGPLAGAAVAAIGGILGVSDATQETIGKVIANGQLTPEQLGQLRALELQYQNDEKERGFRYTELEFKDRDSARKASVEGGTLGKLFWMSVILLCVTLGTEIAVLFYGYPMTVPSVVVGRVLGLMDAVAMMVLAFWYGSTNGSARKTELLAQSEPARG